MFLTSPMRRGKVQKECIEISKMRVYISHQSLFIIEVNTTLEKRDFPVIAAAAAFCAIAAAIFSLCLSSSSFRHISTMAAE